MHFEVLVEDRSGSIVVDNVLRAVLGGNGDNHSWRTHSYRGLGRLPRGLHGQSDPSSRILLQQLPRIMRGYGNSLSRDSSAVVVVVDLDDRDCMAFKRDLVGVLREYVQDSVCGTWELLANAVHAGGSAEVKRAGWPAAGQAKCQWAEKIGPLMKPERNRSPSFKAFQDGVRRLADGGPGSGGDPDARRRTGPA